MGSEVNGRVGESRKTLETILREIDSDYPHSAPAAARATPDEILVEQFARASRRAAVRRRYVLVGTIVCLVGPGLIVAAVTRYAGDVPRPARLEAAPTVSVPASGGADGVVPRASTRSVPNRETAGGAGTDKLARRGVSATLARPTSPPLERAASSSIDPPEHASSAPPALPRPLVKADDRIESAPLPATPQQSPTIPDRGDGGGGAVLATPRTDAQTAKTDPPATAPTSANVRDERPEPAPFRSTPSVRPQIQPEAP